MKHLLNYLKESAGQEIASREKNRPYDAHQYFNDKKTLREYKALGSRIKESKGE